MAGALLDSHAFYWLALQPHVLSKQALILIADSQQRAALHLAAVSAWELAVANQKKRNAPTFGDQPFEVWFTSSCKQTTAKLISITQRIALEAASVAKETGHRDPADCYIIATARVRKIPVITRDAVILKIAASGYLGAVAC